MATTNQPKSFGLLTLSILLLITSLSGCKKEAKITFDDLISAPWYAAEPHPYGSVTFTQKKTYTSESLLTEGRYDILKDGQVYLLSVLNGQVYLTPEEVNGEWVLHGSVFDIQFTLTQKERTKPVTEEELQKDQELENTAMLTREIHFMLNSFEWTTSEGKVLYFSNDSIITGEGTTYPAIYYDGSVSEKGTYVIPVSIEDHMIVCEIEDDWSIQPDFALNLTIREGSKTLLKARCIIPDEEE